MQEAAVHLEKGSGSQSPPLEILNEGFLCEEATASDVGCARFSC